MTAPNYALGKRGICRYAFTEVKKYCGAQLWQVQWKPGVPPLCGLEQAVMLARWI